MVEKQNSGSTGDGQKKKAQLGFNIGNGCVLGGVVLIGGGLAVAGLVAAFTIIKNRNNTARDDDQNKKDSSSAAAPSEEGQDAASPGLGSVLQNHTTALLQNSCCTYQVTPATSKTDSSSELVSAQNTALVQGDKPVPVVDGGNEDPTSYQQEILFSDDLNKESFGSCDEILSNEETKPPAPENVIKNHSVEIWQLTENIMEIKKEEEPAEPENLTLEEDLQNHSEGGGGGSKECLMVSNGEGEIIVPKENLMPPVEEEEEREREQEQEKEECNEEDENLLVHQVEEEGGDDEDDHDDVCNSNHDDDDSSEEDVTAKEEGSSEGTGSSSRESNVEAIWPTDMIEALSHELKVMNAYKQDSVEKMAKTEFDYLLNSKRERGRKHEITENSPILNKKTPQEFVISKIETINLPTREVCGWMLLAVLLLLLLLLHIHYKHPLQDLSNENSVICP